MSGDLQPIVEHVELLLSELAESLQAGPRIRIVHRFQSAGTICKAGEEVWAILLGYRGREVLLALPLALRLLLNYLAETRHIPQSAAQIVAGLRRSAFYAKHGANSGAPSTRRFSRSGIKEYVKRIRGALQRAFRDVGLDLDPGDVLISKGTVGNEVQYQLRARVEWTHVPEDRTNGWSRR